MSIKLSCNFFRPMSLHNLYEYMKYFGRRRRWDNKNGRVNLLLPFYILSSGWLLNGLQIEEETWKQLKILKWKIRGPSGGAWGMNLLSPLPLKHQSWYAHYNLPHWSILPLDKGANLWEQASSWTFQTPTFPSHHPVLLATVALVPKVATRSWTLSSSPLEMWSISILESLVAVETLPLPCDYFDRGKGFFGGWM